MSGRNSDRAKIDLTKLMWATVIALTLMLSTAARAAEDTASVEVNITVSPVMEIHVTDDALSLEIDDTLLTDSVYARFDVLANVGYNLKVQPNWTAKDSVNGYYGVARKGGEEGEEPVLYRLWFKCLDSGDRIKLNGTGTPYIEYDVPNVPSWREMELEIDSHAQFGKKPTLDPLDGATGELPSPGTYEGILELTLSP